MKLMLRTLFSFGLVGLALVLSNAPASADNCTKKCDPEEFPTGWLCRCVVTTKCESGATYTWKGEWESCENLPMGWCQNGYPDGACPQAL